MNPTMAEASAPDAQSPIAHLSPRQLDELAGELDAIRDRVLGELGDRDRRYIESMIAMQRRLAVIGRVLLLASRYRPAKAAGTAALSAAKILENMEIGHNVLHGQWDWMNDPQIHSSTWDWDTASTAEAWKHSHNYVHHTFTNILGKDKDLGYEIMRIDPQQKWHPVYLLQPLYNLLLMALFEWGVAFHDLDFEAIRKGHKSKAQVKRELAGIFEKAKSQVVKDYVAWPLLSALAMAAVDAAFEVRKGGKGRRRRGGVAGALRTAFAGGRTSYRSAAAANATANVVRNVWAYAIIFCGHFPDQTYTFSPEEVENESRGGWYVRQLVGAANIEGSPLFHVASGNLGYQVEHHLFPDLPSSRYTEIAPQVKQICERYGLPYNSGPFGQQLGMVQRTILRLAFPGGEARPKPGPYRGEDHPTL
jgi:NADPH-dependent stearoyl-CoA 9-desaturase